MSFKRRIERRKAATGEWDLRYGGRTVEARLYINTDEDLEVIKERLIKLARGPRLDMAVIGLGEHAGDNEKFWRIVHDSAGEALQKQVEEEN
ncbi:MAG TPA: hypothetical protein VGB13_13425 [Candidatus Krumholzibacteria bacterium]